MDIEKQTIEWKESWRDEYLGWICGYANAKGGILCIGKNDNGVIVGIEKAEKFLEDLPNKIRDILGIIADIDLKTEGHLSYLEIKVEPYPTPINYKGEYHYRTGSTKQVLKGLALNKFLLDKTGIKWDSQPIPYVQIADLDSTAIEYFKNKALLANRISESDLILNVSEILELLHLINDTKPKRAAALLFHPVPEKFITGSIIKIGYFRDNDNTDAVFHDEIRGPLILQAEKTIELLKTKYMEALIKYDGIQRIETFPYPEKALREALLNAIIHKDYSTGVPIQIKVFANKLTIFNMGKLPIELTPEKFLGVHPSIPANPDIANTFYRAGFIESWGRGVQIILSESEKSGLPKPDFNFDFEGLQITFNQKQINQSSRSGYAYLLAHIENMLSQSKQYELSSAELEKIIATLETLEQKSLIIITVLETQIHLKRREIMKHIQLANNTINTKRYLEPLLKSGIVSYTIKDRPNSVYQEYILSSFGKKVAFVLNESLKKSNQKLNS